MQISYRKIKESEYYFLKEMLYEALYVPPGANKFPKSILEAPSIHKYIKDWGASEGDIAIVATDKNNLIAAIWGRKFPISNKSYGFINEQTPEISMAVKAAYRGRGIGTKLLNAIEAAYVAEGVHQLSLSVAKLNAAKKLYVRNGYDFKEEVGTSWTMVKKIGKGKIAIDFVKKQYQSGVESYTDFTKEVGLWESEKYVFEKYLKQSDQILDLGCGTGRTTFPLYQLGYKKIAGLDLTPEMIAAANHLNQFFKTNIDFRVGDARQLVAETGSFDTVIFSFNGLMSIPNPLDRQTAIGEIYRVLKKEGLFIFTTHDRAAEADFLEFWKEEEKRWQTGQQNPSLYQFGDLIVPSKNETVKIFIHIPTQQEVLNLLTDAGFALIETFYRSEKFEESEAVIAKSGACRFWVFKKEI